jgi:hypothetical protein
MLDDCWFLIPTGDTAAGWEDAFPMAGLPNTRYVLPTAETISVSLNMGLRMPSWFDLYGLAPGMDEDSEGILKAMARVHRIIDGSFPPRRVNPQAGRFVGGSECTAHFSGIAR